MAARKKPAAPFRARFFLLTSVFTRFAAMEASSGVLLLFATAVALAFANSPLDPLYESFWNRPLPVGAGRFALTLSAHDWVNDGLMAVFFFLVGLEIKREILVGELASLRKAAFPFIAAFGGSLAPALIFIALNHEGEAQRGWGVPIATDIAFALGVLALLGSRIPSGLKVFVAALAIVDDLFAVLVIAFFYTEHISVIALVLGFVGAGLAWTVGRLGARSPVIYAVIGAATWLAVLHSGVHATIAGILISLAIPVGASRHQDSTTRAKAVSASPLGRMEHALSPWVSFFIMPVFALANAGVPFLGKLGAEFTHPIPLGIILGLVIGKPLGIGVLTWLSTATGIASPPQSVSWAQILSAACLCGIGFTMSLFIAGLAYSNVVILDRAKIGILLASIIAGLAGTLLLRASTRRPDPLKQNQG